MCAISSFTCKEKTLFEVMDVKCDIAADFAVSKKRSSKKSIRKEVRSNSLSFSYCVDECYSSPAKKPMKKKIYKDDKDSIGFENNFESNCLLSTKEIQEEDFNSTVHLRNGSSYLDETVAKETAINSSTIVEKDAEFPQIQEIVHIFHEEVKELDADLNVRMTSRRKFAQRRNSGGIEESDENHPLQDFNSFSESENDTSPSDVKPLLYCETIMQTPSVKVRKKEPREFACDECNRVYTRKDNLINHKKIKHVGKLMFKCATCSKCFQYKHVLADHIKYKHSDAASFDCELCSYKAKREQDLKNHVMAMHEGMVFHCAMCVREFKYESNLRRHIKIVHLKEADHTCTLCGKQFSQASNLKVHMKVTHEKKDLTCVVCKLEFENKQKLSMHLLGHIPKVGFNCPHCDYVLASESYGRMKRHIREKHLNVEGGSS